jgi:hypothetical protein
LHIRIESHDSLAMAYKIEKGCMPLFPTKDPTGDG